MKNTKPSEIAKYLQSIPELQSYYKREYENHVHIIDNYIIELVKIAALCHDLGHGPFSHIFDDHFLPSINKATPNSRHEYRSGLLLEKIIKENEMLAAVIHDDEIKFMKNLIDPQKEHTGFLYQIVSNNLNGLDVDKYDYMERDSYTINIKTKFKSELLVKYVKIIDNDICYPERAITDIISLFKTRYELHKTVYNNKAVISSQFMIIDIFNYLDSIIGISDSINDMDAFCKMTDEYILTCHNTLLQPFVALPKENFILVKEAKSVIDQLHSHHLYSHIYTIITNDKIDISMEDFVGYDTKKIIIYQNTAGYVSGNKKNPFDSMYVYSTKNFVKRKLDITKYTKLISEKYKEYITMIFYKDRDVESIQALRKIMTDKYGDV